MSRTVSAAGSTLEIALRDAVAQLLDEEDAEVKITSTSQAAPSGRVRLELDIADARAEPRAEAERDDQRPEAAEEPTTEELDEEADAAADFLEGLLDAMDLPGDLRIVLHDDHAELEIVEVGTGALIGRRGQTLEAIQELVRCSLQRRFERRSRVKVDAEGYRARRLEKLLEKAEEAIDQVLDAGEPERLEPMDVFERKAIHALVAGVDGVVSRSQGREPARRVVIEPED